MKSKFFVIGVLLVCSCNMLSFEERWRIKRENYVAFHREELQDARKQYIIRKMHKAPFYRWANEAEKRELDTRLDEEFEKDLKLKNDYVDVILKGGIAEGMTVEQVKIGWRHSLRLIFESSGGMSMYDDAYGGSLYYQLPYYTFTFDNGYLESWTKHGGR